MTTTGSAPNSDPPVTHVRVAAVAGVGRATIYRHWPTVEDLLSDVLVDCQDPLPTPTPTGDLRADLVSAIELFADPLHTSKLGEILIATIEIERAVDVFLAAFETEGD